MTANEIKQLIEAGMPDAQVEVLGDDGQHFEATVISEAFAGQSVIAQHRMVYATLGSKMGADIHALGLKTRTPG